MRAPGKVYIDGRRTPTRRFRILVVDDEPDIVESVSRLLRARFDAELEIVSAPDGPTAVEILQRGNVDIVLTDFRMPQMTGLALLERAQTIAPLAVRIMMTAYPDLELAVRAINDEGVMRFLVKPFEPGKLTETIQLALDAIRAREAKDRLISDAFQGGRVD